MPTYRAIPNFYDDEHADLDMLQHDVGFLLSRLPKRAIDVLMLACGTGRAAIPVAQVGHRVVGVDIDEAMLKIAERKARSVGLPAKRLMFERHDLLTMRVKRTFDVAAILFNSFLMFTTLEQQDRVLTNVRKSLKPRGRIYLDVFNPDLARIAEDEVINASVGTFFSHALGVGVQRATHVRATKVPQVRQTQYDYRWFDRDGRERRKTIRFELTYFFPRELTLLLERNDFRVDQMWGDYAGNPIGVESDRIVVQAVRV